MFVVIFGRKKQLFENLESEGAKKYQNIGKSTFQFVKIKFLAMLISNKKYNKNVLIYLWYKIYKIYIHGT